MYELIYVSRAVVDLTGGELETLIGPSRDLNAHADITGMLLYVHDEPAHEGFFVQLLEGPQESVERTYERIRHDALHTDVTLVQRGATGARSFGGWRMRLATTTTDAVLPLVVGDDVKRMTSKDTFTLLKDTFVSRALLTAETVRAG
ncbi:BLUF domain-containing protein [Kineosporia sp. NBRC 101731]|uniref:BLUF domain-containing protein n=1 Tax=Kineosporia sp. NBRC 101731 TaxID=3032199 RepID=UPI0025577583|nr:BLUF domain-containing protein [Kineosporia sp. NBRC 101731]